MARHCRMARILGLFLFSVLPALTAAAESRVERTLTLAPGGRLGVDADSGSVSVTGSAEPGAHIVVTSTSDDFEKRYKLEFDEKPGEVRITGKRVDPSSHKGISVHFEIRVPKATSVSVRTSGGSISAEDLVGDLKAATSGGSIALKRIRGSVSVETSGGSIEADSVDGPLEAHTSGGHVEVADVTADAVLRTSGGSIHVRNAGGRVMAKTSGGSIDATFGRGNARGGELVTSGGSVRVTVDPAVGLTVDAATSAGRITTDFPIEVSGTIGSSSLRGAIGKGGEELRIRTSAGSIEISSLK